MLHAVGVEGGHLAVVPQDGQLHRDLALRREQQLLQARGVLQVLQRLQRSGEAAAASRRSGRRRSAQRSHRGTARVPLPAQEGPTVTPLG